MKTSILLSAKVDTTVKNNPIQAASFYFRKPRKKCPFFTYPEVAQKRTVRPSITVRQNNVLVRKLDLPQKPRLAPLFLVAKNLLESLPLLMTQSSVWQLVVFTRNEALLTTQRRRKIFGTETTKAVIKRFVRLDHFMTLLLLKQYYQTEKRIFYNWQ